VIRINAFSGDRFHTGFTLIELLVSVAIGSLLIMGLSTVTSMISKTLSASSYNHQLTHDAQFAMDQMVRAVENGQRLLLPLADNPNTNWPEHIREQTLPATPPIGDSTLATAALAVTLAADIDLNADGIPDADNDGDGRIDEDLGDDQTSDNAPGIVLIDDDGDGEVDETSGSGNQNDDDEDGQGDEDWLNGLDDDADGTVDEDSSADMNNDAEQGINGVDDDGDGQVDEGSGSSDDDEDGQTDEEYYDAVVFYLDNSSLMQRIPVPWDESGDSVVNGLDFVTTELAENVTVFRVERLTSGSAKLVDLIIELAHPQTAETVRLHRRVRVGRVL
jgi:prepilin-type N-terminal cleavage/methylation domain-containing protein